MSAERLRGAADELIARIETPGHLEPGMEGADQQLRQEWEALAAWLRVAYRRVPLTSDVADSDLYAAALALADAILGGAA